MSPLPSSAFFMTCHTGPSPLWGGSAPLGDSPGGTSLSRERLTPDGASRLLSGSVGRRTPAP